MSQYFNQTENTPTGPAQRGTQPTLHTPSLISMILGIIGLILSLGCGGIFGLVAVVLGIVGIRSISKSNGSLRGKGMAITGLITGGLAMAVFVGFVVLIKNHDGGPIFKAEQSIASYNSGSEQVGFGNTNEAEEIATTFARRMKSQVNDLFDGEVRDNAYIVTSTEGHYLTYCNLIGGDDPSCAFIVHVPNLGSYEEDQKSKISDLAWTVAHSVLKENGFPEEGRLAVGAKGPFNYERVDIGAFYSDIESTPDRGIEKEKPDSSGFSDFFDDPDAESVQE